MNLLTTVLGEYAKLLVEVIPYFTLGTLFAAVLSTYMKPEHAYRFLKRNASSVFAASALAALLPGCSDGSLPWGGSFSLLFSPPPWSSPQYRRETL
ncbi:hypothetical protein [Candidatus Pyrohabitans sp.]